ncbi:MAG: SpoIIE family protein phosphatase [Caldimonas sp.]
MTPYLNLAVTEESEVGAVRRAAVRLAGELALDETACGRIALVATELGANLVRHAREGRMLLGTRSAGGTRCLEIIALDHGPGMADLRKCMADGYSTGGTAGTGLGAAQRLASEFGVYSVVGKGTVIAARFFEAATNGTAVDTPGFVHAGISLAAPGETVSGDAWQVRIRNGKAVAIVADGLGHGPYAAEASDAAVTVFGADDGAPSAVLERAHKVLRSTRGAAVAMAELDPGAGTIVFAGAGNIVGRLISGVGDRSLLSQHGTVGMQIRHLSDQTYPWPEHALLIMHSDGITSRWSLGEEGAGLLQCDPAVIAGWLIREHTRGRDDVTVVVVRRG